MRCDGQRYFFPGGLWAHFAEVDWSWLGSRFFGTIMGALAGYYGGWIDRLVSGYVFNVFLAFPGLLLAIAMVAFLGAALTG